MAINQASITEKEVGVCAQVKDHLIRLGIGFETTERPDILIINEPETNIPITIDAEETVVCLRITVCDEKKDKDFYLKLLRANALISHGHFQIENGKVILAENLEAENLDANELEASIASLVAAVIQNSGWL
ncbi:MAG: CesT family type III secretion system chaperone [Nitrospinae bacterium]|nr:CesT family type III secretion system chaperone [Nitrospinota bacterium]